MVKRGRYIEYPTKIVVPILCYSKHNNISKKKIKIYYPYRNIFQIYTNSNLYEILSCTYNNQDPLVQEESEIN